MTTIEADARSGRKRAEILEAARRRFVLEGYAGAGMEAVARDAAVSTATLYDQFSSKAELFRCVAEETLRALSPSSAAAARGDASSQLNAFALAYARFLSDPTVQMLVRACAAEPRRFHAVAGEFRTRGRDAFSAALVALLKRLGDEGRVFIPKPAAAAGQLLGMIEHAALLTPLLSDEAAETRALEPTCVEAVATFLARWGACASAEAA
jgi:AcrR family transcriptional regulator